MPASMVNGDDKTVIQDGGIQYGGAHAGMVDTQMSTTTTRQPDMTPPPGPSMSTTTGKTTDLPPLKEWKVFTLKYWLRRMSTTPPPITEAVSEERSAQQPTFSISKKERKRRKKLVRSSTHVIVKPTTTTNICTFTTLVHEHRTSRDPPLEEGPSTVMEVEPRRQPQTLRKKKGHEMLPS